jgi:hypothetical protein
LNPSPFLDFDALPPNRIFRASADYFVAAFDNFRLERCRGSCNVYQSVKLSISCQPKATDDFPEQQKQKGSVEDQGNDRPCRLHDRDEDRRGLDIWWPHQAKTCVSMAIASGMR